MAKIRFKRSSHQASDLPEAKATTNSFSTREEQLMPSNIGANSNRNDNKSSYSNISSIKSSNHHHHHQQQQQQQHQQQQQIPVESSDKKKASSRLRFLYLSKHKQQKKQLQANEAPVADAMTTANVATQAQPNTSSNIPTTTITTSSTTNSGRFMSSKGRFKRPSISIIANAAITNESSATAAAAPTQVRRETNGVLASNNYRRSNSTSTNPLSNKTVISTPLPPYELEITDIDGTPFIECPLCVLLVSLSSTPDLKTCGHRTCSECMQRYLKTEINHSRLNITCPICSEPLSQNVIRDILNDDKFYFKYESFMLRKVLAAEPDARWCPAPDCGYAVLANGCASCPRLACGRDGCNTAFCYHCKQEWHPNQTCSAASIQRNKRAGLVLNSLNVGEFIEDSTQPINGRGQGSASQRRSSKTSQHTSTLRPEDIKECPVCSSRIIKMNDGSCNHMTCSICETEFCWLCMKEISDFHYFSPSGCTFWGKKPWSRKKKLLWRLGILVGAPICIVFIAGIAVPAIVIGIPVWAARKLHTRLEKKEFSRYKKNAIITGGVLLSFVVSPIISAMALTVGIPVLLGYVYGVVPLSLCRSSGGCLSANPSVENLHEQFGPDLTRNNNNVKGTDVVSIGTATSHKFGNPSIGETSLYMSNISLETNSIDHVANIERDERKSASNAALAGSIISQNIDDGNSTRALAGSIISKESNGFTLIPAEVHSHGNNSISNGGATNSGAVRSQLDGDPRQQSSTETFKDRAIVAS